jgi:uncharacterized protein
LKISYVIWLDEILEKIIQKHKVRLSEVKEVLSNSTHFRFIEKGNRLGEDVYLAFGQTMAGRYITVFFVYKGNNQALVLSARDMTKAERKKYEQK